MQNLERKQLNRLNEMHKKQLISIICHLVCNNEKAQTVLINNYLASTEDMLQLAVKEYTKRTEKDRYYDYDQTNALFSALYQAVVCPLEKAVFSLPHKVEETVANMIVDFARINARVDASSASRIDYHTALSEIWLKSLINQNAVCAQINAQKILNLYHEDLYFDIKLLDRYKVQLGFETLRKLQTLISDNGDPDDAIEIGFFIHDVNFLHQALNNGWLWNPHFFIKFAQLLIDELSPEQAINLLASSNQEIIKKSGYQEKWAEVYSQALIEEGQTEQAKAICLDAFKINCNTDFYNVLIKTGVSDELTRQFTDIARQKSFKHYITFLAHIQSFEDIDHSIMTSERHQLDSLLDHLPVSFIRTLSGQLYQHGYTGSAVLLRRTLVEYSINRQQIKYYNHAALDLKNSIEYSEELTADHNIESTEIYIQYLYKLHKRKAILWHKITEKIPALVIKSGEISYINSQ